MGFMRKIFSVDGNEDLKFWVSHLIILLATVLGVYLAASAGLKSAVQFELIKSDRDSYYMRSALLDELNDNIRNIQDWGAEYEGGGAWNFIGHAGEYNLDTYVWTTMKEAAGTFEIPSTVLTGIRRYYNNTEVNLNKMTSNDGAADQVRNMLEQTETLAEDVLPFLELDIENLAKRLHKAGIDL